ncbi:lactate dehydrogenase [Sphingobacterium sp. SRCM116780]|uniref:lactate dehydrogenase n=1 Tax=Sphingobacterium sp. SRCM116780 TaxID=2907623 RepID=UPI001F244E99|nr:lactate dehydrogenase [Sphingobacterium sp. SRCM116780]UIR56605.1 lactate dehydrogenase [Sphingobacterium sp. SRCM116780]
MKVVVYSIQTYEKKLLAIANGKIHDLTLISNELNEETKAYALGKDVVIISGSDTLQAPMLRTLKNMGVGRILTRTLGTAHIDLVEAGNLDMQVANTPYEDQSPKGIAEQTIRNLNLWGSGRCVGTACRCLKECVVKFK